jgi:hypothetical protein
VSELRDYAVSASRDAAPSKLFAARHVLCRAAFFLLPVALWCLTHRYRGLIGDAELYALQALSRTDASLAGDVFLRSASQDRYTVFSPFYAFFMRVLGLQAAAVSLLVLCKVCFYGSAWGVARKLFDSGTAALTTALLIVAPCEYGAYHVFRISEDMLTARSAAEALSMTGLCLHIHGRKGAALAITLLALCVHAIMALPMLLLLMSLRVGSRASTRWALAVVTAALCAASMATWTPHWTPSFLSVMDPSWLEMVRERSQFVFLQLWRPDDWVMNARPIVSLVIGMLVLRDTRIRALGAAALIVGAAGLMIASIAGSVGPVAILLQGQAWRWIWIPQTIAVLVLAPAVLQTWREDRCGPLCAVLLLGGWIVPIADSVYYLGAALILWIGRTHIPAGLRRHLRWVAAAVTVLVLARVALNGWSSLSHAADDHESAPLRLARSLFALDGAALVLAFLAGYVIMRSRSFAVRGLIALALGTVTALAAPGALENPRPEGTPAQIEEFSDWRSAIPAGENVFVPSSYYSAAFTWFTLQRPSYLTVDQSSGAIFSRDSSIEIRRRSQVLLPLEQPDWRLMSGRESRRGKLEARAAPLTRERLEQICRDPALNFVVAQEDVGFEPLPHRGSGAWRGWNLYDCKRVNASGESQ